MHGLEMHGLEMHGLEMHKWAVVIRSGVTWDFPLFGLVPGRSLN